MKIVNNLLIAIIFVFVISTSYLILSINNVSLNIECSSISGSISNNIIQQNTITTNSGTGIYMGTGDSRNECIIFNKSELIINIMIPFSISIISISFIINYYILRRSTKITTIK